MKTGTVIVIRRKLLGITQQDLADVCHVSRQHIASIEQGDISPNLHLAFILSSRLGGSVYEYFNSDGYARGWADSTTKFDYIRSLPNLGSYQEK